MASCVSFLLVAVFVVMVSTVLADPAPQKAKQVVPELTTALQFITGSSLFGVARCQKVRVGVDQGRVGGSGHTHGHKTSGGYNNGAQYVGEGVKYYNPSVLRKEITRPKGQGRSGLDGSDPSLGVDGGVTRGTMRRQIYY